ncbi:GNAT family N-acetyltransferase [Legionella maceachernii]|uniref:GNAT family acetyltransferase n=1 Tax=Legionella maceachernii TaxID=466 RepID=A0A0W0VVQ5_9GAMM|nr:GNAT family N-acetyltransferase [Legionella maceachernii]KTD24110.1 GNAT family acetyltransferase [Legionella maceachernii]SJZ86386.1 Acetyltransferase (GNAT) family protein [Legionella maceachernii]SUO99049.1 TDP-fucosamine acetyltransferase [Legionella maceachernii]
MITIENITAELAESLCRKITADLPEYFGLPEANEHYAQGVKAYANFAAKKNGNYIGLISINFPYPNNANIYWMAVLRAFHRQTIGEQLIDAACEFAKKHEAKTMTVETLSPSEKEENYMKTYQFYQSTGFIPLFNLKPQEYEWDMVYMVKNLESSGSNKTVSIKPLSLADIPTIIDAFQRVSWQKSASLFEGYYQEQQKSERIVWLAYLGEQFTGYITLKWLSQYEPFVSKSIPEIMDLNVLPEFRQSGIGSTLLQVAEEKAASQSDVVGIGVGLYGGADGGYGQAQRLYVKRGYLPDGLGVTYDYQPTVPGQIYSLDDDLILWFTKKLR